MLVIYTTNAIQKRLGRFTPQKCQNCKGLSFLNFDQKVRAFAIRLIALSLRRGSIQSDVYGLSFKVYPVWEKGKGTARHLHARCSIGVRIAASSWDVCASPKVPVRNACRRENLHIIEPESHHRRCSHCHKREDGAEEVGARPGVKVSARAYFAELSYDSRVVRAYTAET